MELEPQNDIESHDITDRQYESWLACIKHVHYLELRENRIVGDEEWDDILETLDGGNNQNCDTKQMEMASID